tara:strand:- start:1 stop:129 length:129 start_codon:yes stop_codon:yes gene_type:complete
LERNQHGPPFDKNQIIIEINKKKDKTVFLLGPVAQLVRAVHS